jgi:D-alanyl-D-alanine carboxypeptidase (penicillin-binding protein 5/6)
LVTGVKAAYLTDYDGAQEMYAYEADKRYPIASMVKIMTALLAVEAIEAGEMTLEEQIVVSPTAMGMGGSQMFLNAGDAYTVDDLLKGVVVVSANDACVALAERLAGSESAFVDRMNSRAAALGMRNTHFANCTGLPHPEGYSSARDVAAMFRALAGSDVYHRYSTIWLEDFHHPDGRTTTFTNTNKLVRFYPGCDGGKTGYTAEAGFCLATTAVKNDMRAISVVIGARDSKSRFAAASTLLNYAFANYRYAPIARVGDAVGTVEVRRGRVNDVSVGLSRPMGVLCRVGAKPQAQLVIETADAIAPLAAGDVLGKAYLTVDGVVTDSCDLVALSSVERGTFGDALRRLADGYPVR